MTETTKERLRKLHGDILARANGFAEQPGLFSGPLVSEELAHWTREIWEIFDDA